jgi:hypothetical protein
MKHIVVAFALILPLAGCATFTVGLPCNVGPFTTDKGASTRWSRSEKEQLVTLNETGEKFCGWRAPA